jgi:TetR/AcrR family transcriptional regulator, fatty acid biosynthesis regulator
MSTQHHEKIAPGKRLLLDAAAKLVANHSSASMVSLRELAREAGLNHNTFYRHFSNFEDLLQTLVDTFGQELREGLAQARLAAPSPDAISHHAMDWLLDFAQTNQNVFLVAIRERYGTGGPLQQAVTTMQQHIEDDMLAHLCARQALPPLPEADLRLALRLIMDNAFHLCMLHIQDPKNKAKHLDQAKAVFDTVVMGTLMRVSASTPTPPTPPKR